MVILKINPGTDDEHEIRIVNERGTWDNGGYHLFSAGHLQENDTQMEQPQNIHGPDFLGELIIDKTKGYWEYKGDKMNLDEQKQIADFIMDYQASDGVY